MHNSDNTYSFMQTHIPAGRLTVLGTVMDNRENVRALDSLSPPSNSLPPPFCPPTHLSSPEFPLRYPPVLPSPHPPHTPCPPPTHCTDKLYIRDLLLFSLLSLNIHPPLCLARTKKTACLCSSEHIEKHDTSSKWRFLGSIASAISVL